MRPVFGEPLPSRRGKFQIPPKQRPEPDRTCETLAQAMITLAIAGAQQYVLDWAKRSLKDTLAAMTPKPPKEE